jgi:hypothetical protein
MSRKPVQEALFELLRRSGDGAAVIGLALVSRKIFLHVEKT